MTYNLRTITHIDDYHNTSNIIRFEDADALIEEIHIIRARYMDSGIDVHVTESPITHIIEVRISN